MSEQAADDLLRDLGGVTAVHTSEVEKNLWKDVRHLILLSFASLEAQI